MNTHFYLLAVFSGCYALRKDEPLAMVILEKVCAVDLTVVAGSKFDEERYYSLPF